MRDSELQSTRDLSDAREQVRIKSEAVTALQDELTDARATIEKCKLELVEAEDRYRLLDEHWTRSSATNVAKKIGSLSEEVRHEVQEAILSLDRDVPNVAMALNRLRRLQAISNRQEGS